MDFESLSAREREVVERVVRGMIDKEIAQEMGVSSNTLRTYWRRIRKKLGNLTRSRLTGEYLSAMERARTLRNAEAHRQIAPNTGWEWMHDVHTGMTLAGDHLNRKMGLPLGTPHPGHLYDLTLRRMDSKRVNSLWSAAVAEGREYFSFSHRAIRQAAGRVFFTAARIEYEDGVPVRVWGHTVEFDSTEIFPRVEAGHWSADPDGGTVSMDECCARILGLTGGTEMTFEGFVAAVAPGSEPGLRQTLERFLEGGVERLEAQTLLASEGEEMPVEIRGIWHAADRISRGVLLAVR